jgi:hypothetical protein
LGSGAIIDGMSILPVGKAIVVSSHEPAPAGASSPPMMTDVSAVDREANENAVDRLAMEASVRATRTHVAWLDGELIRLETENERLYELSQATIQRMQNELAAVLTDRRVHSDDRVVAFFGIAKNNERSQRLSQAWHAHRAKQAELGRTLEGLKTVERELTALGAETLDARLVVFQRRIRGLEELLANLEQQAALLREMIAQAQGTGRGLQALQQSLDVALDETRKWIARARGEAAEDLLARLLDAAGFAAMLILPASAFAAMTPVIGLLRDLVSGSNEPIENFVFRTLGSLASRALVEAGVGRTAANAIVAALREGAGERREGVSAAVGGAALNAAQALVIDFLSRSGDEALPLVALARAVVALGDLREAEARKIVGALATPSGGVEAALSMLEASAPTR